MTPDHGPVLPCRLSVKPDHGPPDDPQCLYCYRPPSENAKALVQFVDYALKQPAVRFITYSDLIHWMQVGGRAAGAR